MASSDIQGPITCLSFHPMEEKIAAGCKGGICSVYDMQAKGEHHDVEADGLTSRLAGLRME